MACDLDPRQQYEQREQNGHTTQPNTTGCTDVPNPNNTVPWNPNVKFTWTEPSFTFIPNDPMGRIAAALESLGMTLSCIAQTLYEIKTNGIPKR